MIPTAEGDSVRYTDGRCPFRVEYLQALCELSKECDLLRGAAGRGEGQQGDARSCPQSTD